MLDRLRALGSMALILLIIAGRVSAAGNNDI